MIVGRAMIVSGRRPIVVPVPLVTIVTIAEAVVIAVAIPVVPAHAIPVAVVIAAVIAVSVAMAVAVVISVAAILGQIAVQLRAICSQAAFIIADALLVAGNFAAFFALADPAVAVFLPQAITVAERLELAPLVPDLLEPVDALRQLLAVDAVVRPAADDLAKPLAEGAAAGQVLDRPPQPVDFLTERRPHRWLLATDRRGKRQTGRDCCQDADHSVLLCGDNGGATTGSGRGTDFH
jgi:hypothetical protein